MPLEYGGDLSTGVGAPVETAARTPTEASALPCPGTPQITSLTQPPIASDPLWPLTLVLGDIAGRVARRAAQEHKSPVPPEVGVLPEAGR